MGCKEVSINFSQYNYPNTPLERPLWEIVIKCLVFYVIILVGIVGNVLIIVIASISKKMRTTTNYYIVNLAVADLLVAGFPMWIYVVTDVTDGWILGAFLCKFNAFVQVTAFTAIAFTMMVIAGDRFFAIVFPFKARVTHRRVKVVMTIVWIGAISSAIPLLHFYTYTERQWKNYLERFCSDIWPMIEKPDGECDQGNTSKRVYWVVMVAVVNWIPMIMMTVSYTIIIHRLRFGRFTQYSNDQMTALQRRSAWRVIKMLFSLLIVFMVCTIPFQVSTLYEIYQETTEKLPDWFRTVYFSAITLMYAHSAINPITYGALNRSFRKGFRHLVVRIRGCSSTAWDSRNAFHESARPTISIVSNLADNKNKGSVKDLVQCATHLNKAVILER